MKVISFEDLRRILVSSAGAPEIEVGEGEFADTSFEDLGYESLALMESAAAIEREYGINVPDEELTQVKTPRELTDLVNATGKAVQS
ncbi:acyl carrier protein [Nocardia sp. NBC_01388]|uniref:acyl carrier protein n=1 Tax=Nocardia sp. NBC_01388 TaxID=2903596 RepID=UPI0032483129